MSYWYSHVAIKINGEKKKELKCSLQDDIDHMENGPML